MSDNLRGAVGLVDTKKTRAVLRRMLVCDQPGNKLLNAFLQLLRCTFYLPTVAMANKLINNIVVVMVK